MLGAPGIGNELASTAIVGYLGCKITNQACLQRVIYLVGG